MSSWESDVVALLGADATLTAILTGGVYGSRDLKRGGLTVANYPTVFNAGFLKPIALIVGFAVEPLARLSDRNGQIMGARQVVRINLYDDGDNTYSALETAMARVYVLLHLQRIGAANHRGFASLISDTHQEIADELQSALLLWSEYAINGTKRGA